MHNRLIALLLSCLLSILLLGGCTTMDNKAIPTTAKYPDKPITLIVPFGVGGGMDLIARMLEKTATTHLGQPLVIVNKPGGAGTNGWNELAGASPDGYTLGITGIEVLLQPLYDSTKYHYPTALAPIAQISDSFMVMIVQKDQPWQTANDLIAYARQHPGTIKFGHSGIGGINHVAGETFAKAAGIQIEQVPFQSSSETVANVLGGHTQVAFVAPASAKEHIKSGTLKALAVASDHRLSDPLLSNVPTFKEQGLDVIGSSWFGIAAPKELPEDIKKKLADGFKAMINDPEFKKNIEQLGLEVNYLGPAETENRWIADIEKLTKAVHETGILEKIQAQKK